MTSIGDMVFSSLVSLGVTGSLVIGGVNLMPQNYEGTADYFEVHAIDATRLGDTASLRVNRSIKKPVEMSSTVRVMERGSVGWREYCIAQGPTIQYRPDAELPDPVTLGWWTWGKCPKLPDGDAQIWTTWTPQMFGLAPVSYVVDIPAEPE
jgi:hypothetical protein